MLLSCRPSGDCTPPPMSIPAAPWLPSDIRHTQTLPAPDAAFLLSASRLVAGLALRRCTSRACSRGTGRHRPRRLQTSRDHCLGRTLVRAPSPFAGAAAHGSALRRTRAFRTAAKLRRASRQEFQSARIVRIQSVSETRVVKRFALAPGPSVQLALALHVLGASGNHALPTSSSELRGHAQAQLVWAASVKQTRTRPSLSPACLPCMACNGQSAQHPRHTGRPGGRARYP